jgi:hypothetical protein
MTAVATQHVTIAGTAPTLAAAATGDTFEVGAACKAVVTNGSGSTITFTVLVPGNAINGIANPDTPYSIVAGASAWVPMYDFYADPTDGRAHVTYSSLTTITRASVKG